jgi:hypothetical protein
MNDREDAVKILLSLNMIVSKTNLLKNSSAKIKDRVLKAKVEHMLVECESVAAYLQCKLEIA